MTAANRRMLAPQLRETADIWWDSGHDPVITWDASGRRYWLIDGDEHPSASGVRLTLAVLTDEDLPGSPEVIAAAFRDGLAACDFPPTDTQVPPARARATLRAAGLG